MTLYHKFEFIYHVTVTIFDFISHIVTWYLRMWLCISHLDLFRNLTHSLTYSLTFKPFQFSLIIHNHSGIYRSVQVHCLLISISNKDFVPQTWLCQILLDSFFPIGAIMVVLIIADWLKTCDLLGIVYSQPIRLELEKMV